MPESESEDEEIEVVAPVKAHKNYTVSDIMGLEKMKIGKKNAKKSKQNTDGDVEMSEKSKGIKKDKTRKRKKVHEKKK